MRTAIYIEDGTTQIVLTPENDWERQVVKSMGEHDHSVKIMAGEFCRCRGGWIRQFETATSLILLLDAASNPSQTPA